MNCQRINGQTHGARARARENPTSQESATVLAAGGKSWLLAEPALRCLEALPTLLLRARLWQRWLNSAAPTPSPGGLTGRFSGRTCTLQGSFCVLDLFPHKGTLSHHPALSYGKDSSGNDPPEQKGGLSTTHGFQTGTNR